MSAAWLSSTLNLREDMARAAKNKDKKIVFEVSTVILEEGETFEPEPIWMHYLQAHAWPEDF